MKITKLFLIILVALLTACSTGLNITTLSEQAKNEYTAGNYKLSLSQWQNIINELKSKNKAVEGYIYAEAGRAAMQLGKTDQALDYFQEAEWADYADPKMYEMRAHGYLAIDNLSKEIDALIYYVEHYPEGEDIMDVQTRLFEAYVKSENWEMALLIWPDIENRASSCLALLEQYFLVNKELGNDDVCDDLAKQFLEFDKENITGLEWLAEKYFWLAENRYQEHLQVYEQKRTTRNYNNLLKAIEKSNGEFNIALEYFLTLYNLTEESGYAKFIGNIYLRFDDKQKADYYYKLAG